MNFLNNKTQIWHLDLWRPSCELRNGFVSQPWIAWRRWGLAHCCSNLPILTLQLLLPLGDFVAAWHLQLQLGLLYALRQHHFWDKTKSYLPSFLRKFVGMGWIANHQYGMKLYFCISIQLPFLMKHHLHQMDSHCRLEQTNIS